MSDHRLRLKDDEIKELKIALLKHIRDLVEQKMPWEKYVLLRNLHYRLSRAGKVRGGSPRKVFRFYHETEEDMYNDMRKWLKYRFMEIQEPKKFQQEKQKVITKLRGI